MDALANPKAIANELAIINDPATANEQPVLVDLVGRLHAARSVKDLFALHTKLLARYLARQRARGELELDNTGVESEIGELAAQTPRPLGRRTRVDRLADDGVGLQAEDAVTVHNDLATILRHADLTTIYPGRRQSSGSGQLVSADGSAWWRSSARPSSA